MSRAGVILVPVAESDEVVEVPVDQLPEDESELTDLLKNESAGLDLWLRFAVEYYRQGKYESFTRILEPIMELNEARADDVTSGASSKLFEIFGNTEGVRKAFLDILNSLAAFHTGLGSRERDKAKKKAEFEKAKRYYDAGENIGLLEGAANVGRAVLQLARGELGRAEKTLGDIEAFHRNSVPALLGKACASFNGGKFRDALKLYRQVFTINPSPPAVVRLGLGYCYHKLNQPRLAQRALERTLELDEENVDAMVGLAVLHLNEEKVAEALDLLKRAYKLEPYNPAVLNHLANHYFYRGNYPQALKFAERANQSSDAKAIRAESCYHLARCHHAQSNYAQALQWYTEAHKLNPDYLAPQFGLGQMHLVNEDYKRAAQCFERVLRGQPKNTDALKALGHIYRRDGKLQDALTKLNAAAEASPGDAGIWLELAQLQQRMPGQLPSALKAYEKAAGILKKPPSTVPPELWNNVATIRHLLGKLESAETAYGYAIKSAALKSDGDELAPSCITTHFNLGRLYEERGEMDRAIDKYKTILQRHPNYPDCFLRLAACSLQAGDTLGAIGWAQKELTLHPRRPEGLIALANIYMANRDFRRADQLLKQSADADSYAAGQRAWILVKQAHAAAAAEKAEKAGGGATSGGGGEGGGASAAASMAATAPLTLACTGGKGGVERIDKAAEMLRKVLKEEPNNLYAANGLGVICVAKGRLNDARAIFTQVREASPACDTATCNLAQLNAALGEHADATSLYKALSRRQAAGDAAGGGAAGSGEPSAGGGGVDPLRLLLLQARSHFASGQLEQCTTCLDEAVTLQPDSHTAWHNLGLSLLTAARHPDGPDAPPRSVKEVTAAQAMLSRASILLRALNPRLVGAAAVAAATEEEKARSAAAGDSSDASPLGAAAASSPEAIKKAEEEGGVTEERRRGVLALCEKLKAELADEAERAVTQEKRVAEEVAAADAKMAAYEEARKRAAEEKVAAKQAEEEKIAAALAEQKARLEEKMVKWREEAQREAEAAAAGERRKKRKKGDEEEEARSGSEDEGGGGAAAAAGGDEEEDADADANLFGSDDESDADGADKAAAGEGGGEEGGEEGGEGGGATSSKKLKKLKKKKRSAEEEAAGGEGADDAEADLFGDDGDDDAEGGEAGGGEGSSSQPTKRRKIALDEDDDDEMMADDAAAAPAPPPKRSRVVDDDDDD